MNRTLVMTTIAHELGVELYEDFEIEGFSGVFHLEEDGLHGPMTEDTKIDTLFRLIQGMRGIIKIPFVPKAGQTYFVPSIQVPLMYLEYTCGISDKTDNNIKDMGIACRTKAEAVALTKVALDAIRKVREGK